MILFGKYLLRIHFKNKYDDIDTYSARDVVFYKKEYTQAIKNHDVTPSHHRLNIILFLLFLKISCAAQMIFLLVSLGEKA